MDNWLPTLGGILVILAGVGLLLLLVNFLIKLGDRS